jgi:hypothetical protein
VIEIEALTKALGLSAFRYRIFPAPLFDDVPASVMSSDAEPATGVGAAEPTPATLGAPPAPAEPHLAPSPPAVHSVLREVADLNPAPFAGRSARPSRAARSAWRTATSPQQPR